MNKACGDGICHKLSEKGYLTVRFRYVPFVDPVRCLIGRVFAHLNLYLDTRRSPTTSVTHNELKSRNQIN